MSEPYNLPLKHKEWVQKELETLERAGVIVRSISPWASPIIIVPKKTEPGEPPRRRLCVDYGLINSLLPEVQKAHSKAKGVLTLVPLPKIDHSYTRLRGSKFFSTFDLRSGYHHMALSLEARAKSAFSQKELGLCLKSWIVLRKCQLLQHQRKLGNFWV